MDRKSSSKLINRTKEAVLRNAGHHDLQLHNNTVHSLMRDSARNLNREVLECQTKFGIFPISFSLPFIDGKYAPSSRRFLLSPIEPRQPYSYNSYEDYLNVYRQSHYALTFKKAGWDCFRHLEIMSTGCIPLMLDANQIPRFTMVHYPKEFLRSIYVSSLDGLHPTEELHALTNQWVNKFLTSRVMMEYVMQIVGENFNKILFVDEALPRDCDYLSVMSLIGLKQLFGTSVHEFKTCNYVYSDFNDGVHAMYGRGFGYTRVLDPKLRDCASIPDTNSVDSYDQVFSEYDLVVVGNIRANAKITKILSESAVNSQKVYLRGDDAAPNRRQMRNLVRLKGYVFSREIYDF